MENDNHKFLNFELIGAGKIEISKSSKWKCGNIEGFSFGVEWGRNRFAGGVISHEEAVKLAEHILNNCGKKDILRKEKLKNINKKKE